MSMPFYVSPEQLMKDRADFARKGIARGRSVVVLQYADGILFVSENPSPRCTRSARSTTGSPSPRSAATTSSRTCASPASGWPTCAATPTTVRTSPAAALANAYAQTLGAIFSHGGEKPYEVEIFVGEVGDAVADDQIYRLTYDGQVADEQGFAAMGGSAEAVTTHLREAYRPGMTLAEALELTVTALGSSDSGTSRDLAVESLEAAVLDRSRSQQRKFKRLSRGRPAASPAPADRADGGEPGRPRRGTRRPPTTPRLPRPRG